MTTFRLEISSPVLLTEMRTISEEAPFCFVVVGETNWPSLEASRLQARVLARQPAARNPRVTVTLLALIGVPLAVALMRSKRKRS